MSEKLPTTNALEDIKGFFKNYFCSDNVKLWEEIKNSYLNTQSYIRKKDNIYSFEENGLEERAIPGGRYGCAQFIKACGP